MHKLLTVLSANILLAMLAEGTVPINPNFNEFSAIPKRSPFIIKKKVIADAPKPVSTSLALRGVTKFDDGWYVTVVDRKDPKTRIVLKEGKPTNKNGLRLVKVNPNKNSYMQTTAVVMSGGSQQTIGFNSTDIKNSIAKASKVVTKAAPKGQPVRPTTSNRPPVPTAGKTTPTPSTNSTGRRPRVRRTPSPTPPVPRTK
ncbi:hypothetical protein [Rubritalea tangerina]|uniref:DUF5666 domain-containing protein n=1 Tax=Rubritalea tangerina TaxID=430798 RepID=A0ABW4ZB01_9BACT